MEPTAARPYHPIEIEESIRAFQADFPDPTRVAFVMMRFNSGKPYLAILRAIRDALAPYGISAVRADDKDYHHDLFANVLTYLYGAGLGVAVFERIESDLTSPNVALELGYMFALRKPVCLLKDRTVVALPTDLMGKLYRDFDPHDSQSTIAAALHKWLGMHGVPREVPRKPREIRHPLRWAAANTETWTADDVDLFFRNLEREAGDAAHRAYDGMVMRNPDGASKDYAVELVRRQIASYGMSELYNSWKAQRTAASGAAGTPRSPSL